MIQRLVEGSYTHARLFHVRMAFAREMDDMGTVRVGKLWHAIAVVGRVVWLRATRRAHVLYYPPSGPMLGPALRDAFILILTRWMFAHTILHFHAAGTSQLLLTAPRWARRILRVAYRAPTLGIRTSTLNPDDATALGARYSTVVANGIDVASRVSARTRPDKDAPLRVLFVGLLSESKGVSDLVEALGLLHARGTRLKATLVGRFASPAFERKTVARVLALGLTEVLTFPGVLSGSAKDAEYENADVFCYPSYFEAESFGLVVVEAMQFQLPVVAARWRGVAEVVREGDTGFLVEPRDPSAVADRLALLARDSQLRARMGARGREVFLAEYTTAHFRRRMDECFEFMESLA